MGLTGPVMLVLAVLSAVGMPVATLACWRRLAMTGPQGWPARAALLLSCQLTALLLVGVSLNDTFLFYGSWSELLGGGPRQAQRSAVPGSLDPTLADILARHARAGVGTLVPLPIIGVRSGVRTGPATVYLPPQYGDPRYAHRDFPVVELLSGFPGGPTTWVRTLHLAPLLDALISDGRAAPFIAVAPVQNVDSPRDTECVDVVGGPKVATYLTYDVRSAVEQAFRASPDGSQWTIMGDSTGGYCAADLALQHPDLFVAAVSIAGYDAPAHDATTGNLFGDRPWLSELYSPIWLVRHRQLASVHLLLISTRSDRTAYRSMQQMVAAARPPLQLATLTLPSGGHNFRTFAAELPVGFGWLSRYVAAPLTPLPTVAGQSPREVDHPNTGPIKARD